MRKHFIALSYLFAVAILTVGAAEHIPLTAEQVPIGQVSTAPVSVNPQSPFYPIVSGGGGVDVAGTRAFQIDNTGVILTNGFSLKFSAGVGGAADVTLGRTGAGLPFFSDADLTPLIKFNVSGAPALSACNDGVIATGSSNSSGRVDSAATMVGCTLTFSTPFSGNSADCVMNNLVANRGNITASSSTAFTVANLTAGDDFTYTCFGR